MFQGKGFIILLVIAVVALKQFEAKPHLVLPKLVTKGVDVEIKKTETVTIDKKVPIKIAAAVKTAAALKAAALVKGAVIVKGVKAAAIVKGATVLKAGVVGKSVAAVAKKPVDILDTVKEKIVDIVKPSSLLSIDATKPLLG